MAEIGNFICQSLPHLSSFPMKVRDLSQIQEPSFEYWCDIFRYHKPWCALNESVRQLTLVPTFVRGTKRHNLYTPPDKYRVPILADRFSEIDFPKSIWRNRNRFSEIEIEYEKSSTRDRFQKIDLPESLST